MPPFYSAFGGKMKAWTCLVSHRNMKAPKLSIRKVWSKMQGTPDSQLTYHFTSTVKLSSRIWEGLLNKK